MSNWRKKTYYATYDLDGSFEFYQSKYTGAPLNYSGHLLGPFENKSEAKKEVIAAFKFCIQELKGSIDLVRKTKI